MNLLRPLAALFGYDIVRNSRDVFLERHLHNMFQKHGIDTVIDVGANEGQYGKMLRNIGFTGTILSFEPLSDAYQILSTRARSDKNWHTYNFALGDREEELDLNVTNYNDFSSFLLPNAYSESTFQHKSRVDRHETVTIRMLDNVFNDLPDTSNQKIHLKMDTQGYDLKVFSGATNSLQHVRTMQSEISIRELYEGMPDYITSLSAFRDAGFNISGLFPVTRDKNDLSVIEFDCVMVKS